MKKPVSKLGTILIIITTVILAGIAIFTAIRLYELRQEPVAPNVPESLPKAENVAPVNNCSITFTISGPTESPIPTLTATPTTTAMATATPLTTLTPTPTGYIAPTPTATPTKAAATPTSTSVSVNTTTPTPTEASLPQSGTGWPTLFGAGFGILIILGAILLAL